MISYKVCVVGSFAVGKTSLVGQFVHSIFSDKYLSTVGVKISKKVIAVDTTDILLMLWDMEGKDCFAAINMAYLRGAAGFFLVADCTRRETLLEAMDLRKKVLDFCGDVPHCLLINKTDMVDLNELTDADYDTLHDAGVPYIITSAKTGQGVNDAFSDLARAMLARWQI